MNTQQTDSRSVSKTGAKQTNTDPIDLSLNNLNFDSPRNKDELILALKADEQMGKILSFKRDYKG